MPKLYRNIENLLTLEGVDRYVDSSDSDVKNLSIVRQAALLECNGKISWQGSESRLDMSAIQKLCEGQELEEVDLGGRDVLPAFVECHTHLVFAGDRSEEFELRNQGVSYQEIAANGGGILSTVKATRKASEEQLRYLAQKRVDKFLRQGVTVCEVKSGYGLSHEQEMKILRVASQLVGVDIVPTFLGPHAKSPDMEMDQWFQQIIDKTLPEVMEKKLAQRADIFIEDGFFSYEQGKRYYERAQQLGFQLTGHVEQMSRQGGAALAESFSASSVDHVIEISDDDIARLSKSGTVSVLLPGADFYLRMKYPPARKLLDAGARVALATDFNPGSCPTQDLSMIGVLARLEMKMSLSEVIAAYTINAARALNCQDTHGSLEVGKQCDFVVLDDSYRTLFYQVGYHPVYDVYRGGKKSPLVYIDPV